MTSQSSRYRRICLHLLNSALAAFTLSSAHGEIKTPERTAEETVVAWQLQELAATMTAAKLNRCEQRRSVQFTFQRSTPLSSGQQSLALLFCLGIDLTGSPPNQPAELVALDDTGEPQWLVSQRPQVQEFEALLQAAMSDGLTTGYNVVPSALWPEVDPHRTLIYGHSSWPHARQLIALLLSEGLRPRIIPLQKKSAFVYRDNWGEPESPLPRLADGRRYIDQLEYDLFIEFQQAQDMTTFVELVNRYAKKDTEGQQGLIVDAWWQPFYRSVVAREQAHQLIVMLVTYKGYRTNLMALPEQAPDRMDVLAKYSEAWRVEAVPIWVNPAFYRHQLGDYR